MKKAETIELYVFKVMDYNTTLYGHKGVDGNDSPGYYVQRGDGMSFFYQDCRILWVKKLKCEVVK